MKSFLANAGKTLRLGEKFDRTLTCHGALYHFFFKLKAKILFSIYNFLSSLNATAGLFSKMLACLQTSIHLNQ